MWYELWGEKKKFELATSCYVGVQRQKPPSPMHVGPREVDDEVPASSKLGFLPKRVRDQRLSIIRFLRDDTVVR